MYINTLFNLSDGQLDAYTSFAKEKGLDIYCKEIVLATMAMRARSLKNSEILSSTGLASCWISIRRI